MNKRAGRERAQRAMGTRLQRAFRIFIGCLVLDILNVR